MIFESLIKREFLKLKDNDTNTAKLVNRIIFMFKENENI